TGTRVPFADFRSESKIERCLSNRRKGGFGCRARCRRSFKATGRSGEIARRSGHDQGFVRHKGYDQYWWDGRQEGVCSGEGCNGGSTFASRRGDRPGKNKYTRIDAFL